MAITLLDLMFPIKTAEIWAAIPDPYWCDTYNGGENKELQWGLDIRGDDSANHKLPAPSVYHESLRFPIRRWMDIAHQSVSWDTPDDDESGEPNGGFYVVEHESINTGSLRILDRNGTDFQIEWDGACNVFWDDKYGEDVPFSVRAVARFTGVTVRGSEHENDDLLRDRLALRLDPKDFIQHGFQKSGNTYESGVGMVECRFTPKYENAK